MTGKAPGIVFEVKRGRERSDLDVGCCVSGFGFS